MRIKQDQTRAIVSVLTTYAAFVFASWQFNPATWPEDARFAFILCVAGLYVLNYISAVEK